MAEGREITIPGVGPVDRRWLYGGLAVVAVVVGFAYWQRSRLAGTADDPGLVAELAPEQQTTPGIPGPAMSFDPSTVDSSGRPQSNDEWVRQCVDIMEGLGWNPQLVATTLGRYLSGAGLSAAEVTLVITAIGLKGRPPVGEHPVIQVGTPSTPAPAPAPTPTPTPAPAGPPGTPVVHHVTTTRTSADVQWRSAANAAGYTVYVSGPGLPIPSKRFAAGAVTHYVVGGLRPNTRYYFSVRAYNSAKQSGPLSNIATTTTKA